VQQQPGSHLTGARVGPEPGAVCHVCLVEAVGEEVLDRPAEEVGPLEAEEHLGLTIYEDDQPSLVEGLAAAGYHTACIGGVGFFPFILAIDAKIPVKTPQEFVAWARENKGKTFYGYGTPTVQIPMEASNRIEKLHATAVPYKRSPNALADPTGAHSPPSRRLRPHRPSNRRRRRKGRPPRCARNT